jgi:hypothetical protein
MKGVGRLVRPACRAEPAGPAAEPNLNLHRSQTVVDLLVVVAGSHFGDTSAIRHTKAHLGTVSSLE